MTFLCQTSGPNVQKTFCLNPPEEGRKDYSWPKLEYLWLDKLYYNLSKL